MDWAEKTERRYENIFVLELGAAYVGELTVDQGRTVHHSATGVLTPRTSL